MVLFCVVSWDVKINIEEAFEQATGAVQTDSSSSSSEENDKLQTFSEVLQLDSQARKGQAQNKHILELKKYYSTLHDYALDIESKVLPKMMANQRKLTTIKENMMASLEKLSEMSYMPNKGQKENERAIKNLLPCNSHDLFSAFTNAFNIVTFNLKRTIEKYGSQIRQYDVYKKEMLETVEKELEKLKQLMFSVRVQQKMSLMYVDQLPGSSPAVDILLDELPAQQLPERQTTKPVEEKGTEEKDEESSDSDVPVKHLKLN